MSTQRKEKKEPLLKVNNLRVSFHTYAGEVQAVRGISFEVNPGEVLAIIGESGCGKSVTARTIMSLIRKPGEIKQGSSIIFDGKDVTKMTKQELREYRGGGCAMIFQDALVSLDPTMRIGKQIEENLKIHTKLTKEERKKEIIRLLERVGIPNAERRAKQYAFEFSGGMRQRAMIAMAIACSPKLVIADEPTTALDVTIQAQIMELLKQLCKENNTAVLLITHDFGVVAGSADKVAVMYAGQIIEYGERDEVFYNPKHPYTWALMGAVPRLDWKNKQLLRTIKGTPPDLIAPPKGCPFANRCELCMYVCQEENPPETEFEEKHIARCWLYDPELPEDIKKKSETFIMRGGDSLDN